MSTKFLRRLCWSPDDGAGSGGEDKGKDKQPDGGGATVSEAKYKEVLKELAKTTKERDLHKAEADKYRGQVHAGHKERVLADLLDPKYAKFVPDLEFDDDGKPTEKSQKALDEFRSEFPDFWKQAAGAGGSDQKKDEKKVEDKKPVPPAGAGGAKDIAFFNELRKSNPAEFAKPENQKLYLQACIAEDKKRAR